MGSFETFEHTADLGLRISGEHISDLFITASRALTAQLTDPESVVLRESRKIELSAETGEELLHAWLSELLYLVNGEHWLAGDAEILSISDTALVATVRGEPVDPDRHQLGAEIKAVTWHGFGIERSGDGSLAATVIFDV